MNISGNQATADRLAMPYSDQANNLLRYTRDDAIAFLNLSSVEDAREFLSYQHRENQQARIGKVAPLEHGLMERYWANPLFATFRDEYNERDVIAATITASHVMRLALRFLERAKHLQDDNNQKAYRDYLEVSDDAFHIGWKKNLWLDEDLEELADNDYLYCAIDGRDRFNAYMPVSLYTKLLESYGNNTEIHDDSYSWFKIEPITNKNTLKEIRRKLPASYKKCEIAQLRIPFGNVIEHSPNGLETYSYFHDFNDLATSLFALHLRGIRTVLGEYTHNEERYYQNGLAYLWWHIVDMQRDGRVFTCDACGKICIATNKQGSERRFCSDACRLWAYRNPGKKRSPRR